MIWAHSGKMHWISRDLNEVIMDVIRTDDGMWAFTAIGETTGILAASSIHTHPIEAMRAGRMLWEQFNGK